MFGDESREICGAHVCHVGRNELAERLRRNLLDASNIVREARIAYLRPVEYF